MSTSSTCLLCVARRGATVALAYTHHPPRGDLAAGVQVCLVIHVGGYRGVAGVFEDLPVGVQVSSVGYCLVSHRLGVCVCVCGRFLGISKNMNALWMTLARAGPDLATFLVGFLLVSVGFAFTANLLFGPYLAEYHRVSTAFNTLLRVPLGDMDYAALAQARPSLAPAFFTVYVVLIFLIILNMFVGIVTKYFNDVHQEIKQQDFWKSSALSWEGERMLAARATYMYVLQPSPADLLLCV